MMQLKINFEKILFALTITALCQPLGTYDLSIVGTLYSIGKFIALFYALYLIITKRVLLDRFIISVLVFLVFLLIPTVVNSGDIRLWFMQFYLYGSTCIIVQYWIRRESSFTIKCIANILSLILLINLITFFQNGVDYAEDSRASITYLIGIRTRIGDISYLAYAMSLLGFLVRKRKIIPLNLPITIFASFYFIIFNSVSTSLLCTIIFVLFLIFTIKFDKILRSSIFITFFGSFLFCILIIFIKIQDKFSWLIEGLLHESLTLNGRTYIWDSVLAQMGGHWVIGHGLGAVKEFKIIVDYTTGTHNQFMDVLFNSGLIGLALFLFMVFMAVIKLNKASEKLTISILGAAFLAYSISMISEVVSSNAYFYILLTFCANAKFINFLKGRTNIK